MLFSIRRKAAFKATLTFVLLALLHAKLTCPEVCCSQEKSSAAAMALLRGVEAERSRYRSIRTEIMLEYRDANAGTMNVRHHFVVEQHNDQRRCEHLADSTEPAVYILGDDVVYGYRRKPGADLDVYDMRRAVGTRGDVAFDPRIVGLTNTMTADASVSVCLWLARQDFLDVVGTEDVNGVSTTRVKMTRGGMTSELWISQPGFRVHRRTYEWTGGSISVDSEYNANDSKSPFPKRVIIHNRGDGNDTDGVLDVITMDLAAAIAPERFAIASIGLPVNTMINDYRVNQITGYWDGLAISEKPVYEGATPKAVTPPIPRSTGTKNSVQTWLILINGIVFAGLLIWLWQSKKRVKNG